MKPKEYLLKHGHIKAIGRGRMSREHIAIIEDAVKSGVNIEGYSSTPSVEKATKSEKVVVKTEKTDVIFDVPPPSRDESMTEAHSYRNGDRVKIGMRTVCNICRCSLTHCPCMQPRVWLDHDIEGVVNFTTLKNPVKRKWY